MSLRRVPLEVIQCRHCDKSYQTSENHLCKALLCQDCFEIRETNRKGYPSVIHEKAEHNIGDRYGENRGKKMVVCAACGQIYDVYKRLTDNLSRSCLEDSIKMNPLLYSDGPLNGWTNEILCKSCFDNVQDGFEIEIKQMHEYETERYNKAVAHRANEEVQHRQKVSDELKSDQGFWKLMIIIFLIFAIPMLLKFCSSINLGDIDATEIYYRK